MKAMKLQPAAIAIFLAAIASASSAQTPPEQKQPPSPEQIKQGVQLMAQMMGPLIQVMIEAPLVVLAKPETAARLAAFKGNLFREFVRQGFTQEQAMELTINTSAPLVQIPTNN